jgi:signal recognition particle receptor subunit beta
MGLFIVAFIDVDDRIIAAKLVYFGPARSGKTTNLRAIRSLISAEHHAGDSGLDAGDTPTVWLDSLEIITELPPEYSLKLRLFSVSGQIGRDAARLAVMAGADGVVFVADASPGREIDNQQSMEELQQALSAVERSTGRTIPVVAQINKLDLDQTTSRHEMEGLFASAGWPIVYASALNRQGVAEGLREVLRAVIRGL